MANICSLDFLKSFVLEEEVENDSSSLDGHEQNAFLTPEPSLSGLTFRDPDTGITYVQTQLLQVNKKKFLLNSCVWVL